MEPGRERSLADEAGFLALAAGSSTGCARGSTRSRRTRPGHGDGPVRIALLDPTPERRALARKVIDRGKAWRGNEGHLVRAARLCPGGGKLAYLFPGIEATFAPKVADVAVRFGIPMTGELADPAADANPPRASSSAAASACSRSGGS